MLKKILSPILLSLSLVFALGTGAVQAKDKLPVESAGSRLGLGQDAPTEPPKLKNLRLDDPLVQQKYLNEPDMLRFLRASYAEACTRGIIVKATTQMSLDPKKEYPPDARELAGRLLEAGRLWKMSSFELEVLVGEGYLGAANYCDCMMKEVTSEELVDPKKGMETLDHIGESVRNSCQVYAKDMTDKQLRDRAKRAEDLKKKK